MDERLNLFRELDRSNEKKLKKGEYLIHQGDDSKTVYYLAEGTLKVIRDNNVFLSEINAPDLVGEIAYLLGEERSANVIAETDCKVFEVNPEKSVLPIARILAERLFETSNRLSYLVSLDVSSRLIKELRRISAPFDEHFNIVRDTPSHKDLALRIGTSREVVTRSLKLLESTEELKWMDDALLVAKQS
jgi:CRP-like cAMP-binding protein